MRAQPKASHYINGSFVDDAHGARLPVTYPATGETIAELNAATENVVELAVEAAREAQPAWARLKPVERGRILRRAADILREAPDIVVFQELVRDLESFSPELAAAYPHRISTDVPWMTIA